MAALRTFLFGVFLVHFGVAAQQDGYSDAAEDSSHAGGAPGQSTDASSLLQKPTPPAARAEDALPPGQWGEPHVVPLRRESVPIYRRGKIASFKTSYSGVLRVGSPAQEFRVVFDTGSGHVVLPAAECKSEACLVHRSYNTSASATSLKVISDGTPLPEDQAADQVTIGFGTGQITGEFARDKVCLGPAPGADAESTADADASEASVVPAEAVKPKPDRKDSLCVDMSVIVAVEMSTQPFKTFRFDGIIGLGLRGLAVSKDFSAVDRLFQSHKIPQAHFSIFLTEGEDGEESEIALGGVNFRRLLEPISWAPVRRPELGYWQVQILSVRIGGEELDMCKDGTCRGVVDTGTSHLGIPAPFDVQFGDLLTRPAEDLLDCRLADAPTIEFELVGKTITLHPFNYMRRLPLREGVNVGSVHGVYLPSNETNSTLPPAASSEQAHTAAATSAGEVGGPAETEEPVKRFCRPRLMPVRLPAPLGPKLFILGEPLLHRYYTVFDSANLRVGFALANNRRNKQDPLAEVNRRGELPKEVDVLLVQKGVTLSKLPGKEELQEEENEESVLIETVLLQVEITIFQHVDSESRAADCAYDDGGTRVTLL